MASGEATIAPWFARAVQAIDLRRKDRLLLVLPGSVAAAKAVRPLVGSQGAITVLEPQRKVAEAIAAQVEAVDVLALEPTPDERFGAFDAVLAAPFAGPLPEVAVWGGLLAHNLRPGGRFVVDLPAPDPLPDATAAAAALDPKLAAQLQALAGPPLDELTAVLQQAGMRRVEPLLGTHLLQLSSPLDLVDLVATACRLADEERSALLDALTRRLQSTAACETLLHRTALAGMR